MSRRRLRPGAAVFLALCGVACAGPVLRQRQHQVVPSVVRIVAVVPFRAAEHFEGSPEVGAPDTQQAAALVSRFVSEALGDQGIEVVSASEVRLAFQARGRIGGGESPEAAATLAAEVFGASSVLLGSVSRFRERRGGAQGALRPASVAFELALYTAPQEELVWTARFDETQVALTENLFRARQYPGGGTRWLTAAELARWGAERAARAIGELP